MIKTSAYVLCYTNTENPTAKICFAVFTRKKTPKTIKAEKVAPNAELKIIKFTYQCSVKDMN